MFSWLRKPPAEPPRDLFGNPLDRGEPFVLNKYQKRQAVLLYHWTSLEYLQGLKSLIDAFIAGADVTLELSQRQGRDALIANERWGVRDTSANWSTYAHPALEAFRQGTIKDIAARSNEDYGLTGAHQCSVMLNEHSSRWMTAEEEEEFNKQWAVITKYAHWIDQTAGPYRALNDWDFVTEWSGYHVKFGRRPKLLVRTDVEAQSGERPPKTGVYVPQDDPLGALQFAWTGGLDAKLKDCVTFNDLGRDMVAQLGRDALWVDGQKMAGFATEAVRSKRLRDLGGFDPGDERDPEWAPAILSGQVFTRRPCKWYLVEQVPGEFEDDEPDEAQADAPRRCEAGQPCPREGWWFTPAKAHSRRHFKVGEVMPDFRSDWGQVIWQWDERQGT
jgi:hypothetical protein